MARTEFAENEAAKLIRRVARILQWGKGATEAARVHFFSKKVYDHFLVVALKTSIFVAYMSPKEHF